VEIRRRRRIRDGGKGWKEEKDGDKEEDKRKMKRKRRNVRKEGRIGQ